MISSDIRRQLRQAGLRVTAPRECALRWLAEHPARQRRADPFRVAQLDEATCHGATHDDRKKPTHYKEAR